MKQFEDRYAGKLSALKVYTEVTVLNLIVIRVI